MKAKLALFFKLNVVLGLLSVSVQGCGHVDTYIPCEDDTGCRPDPAVDNGYKCFNGGCHGPCKTVDDCRHDDICFEGQCTPPYAVPVDAGDGGKTSAICGPPCRPVPEGWSSAPALWFGPVADAPAHCPPQLGDIYTPPVFAGRADPYADPANCDVCRCGEATGECSALLPSSIEIRAATCMQPESSSLPFEGPANWDGSCTSANAIPAGKKCPTGSSTLCAQSIAAGTLALPAKESCEPSAETLPIAYFGLSGPGWKKTAIGYRVPGCDESSSCLPTVEGLPDGFRSCVYQRGEHECPAPWSDDRFVVYEPTATKSALIDGRGCTPCECGAPAGSACIARLRTFEDGACNKLLADVQVASTGEQCTNILLAGSAVGSKEIKDLAYVAGSCEPIGGEPVGSVVADPEQAVTVCCGAAV